MIDDASLGGVVVLDGKSENRTLPPRGGLDQNHGLLLDFPVAVKTGMLASSDTIEVGIEDIRTTRLGNVSTGTLADADGAGAGTGRANVRTQVGAVAAGDILDNALSQINANRASVGSLISRFEFASANLATSVENLDAARSTLLDVDMAAEMSNFSSQQVLMQASVAMLAQANQMPQQLLRLLQ